MFAGDNETISDVVSAPSELEEITQEHNIDEVESSQSDEGILEAGNNVINVVNVKDSYNEFQLIKPILMVMQLSKI